MEWLFFKAKMIVVSSLVYLETRNTGRNLRIIDENTLGLEGLYLEQSLGCVIQMSADLVTRLPPISSTEWVPIHTRWLPITWSAHAKFWFLDFFNLTTIFNYTLIPLNITWTMLFTLCSILNLKITVWCFGMGDDDEFDDLLLPFLSLTYIHLQVLIEPDPQLRFNPSLDPEIRCK